MKKKISSKTMSCGYSKLVSRVADYSKKGINQIGAPWAEKRARNCLFKDFFKIVLKFFILSLNVLENRSLSLNLSLKKS